MENIIIPISPTAQAHFTYWRSVTASRTLVLYTHGMQHPNKHFTNVELSNKNYAFTIPFHHALLNPGFANLDDGPAKMHTFAQAFMDSAEQFFSQTPRLYIYPYLFEQSPSVRAALNVLGEEPGRNYDVMYFDDLIIPQPISYIGLKDLLQAPHPDGAVPFHARYDSFLLFSCRGNTGGNKLTIGFGANNAVQSLPNGLYRPDDSLFISLNV